MTAHPVARHPSSIPAPRRSGTTTTTDLPLWWGAWGPAGAPRLLLLHGGPGAHHDYLLPQMLDLARDHEVVTYDQRGGGRSRHSDPEPVTWRTHVRDLAAVVRELLDGAPTLVGYSWGGLLTLLYAVEAARDPAWLDPERLVLIDPAPVARQYRATFEAEFARRSQAPAVQSLRAELTASGLRERDPAAHRQRAFELSVAGYFHDPHRATDLTPFRVQARVQQETWDSLGDYDLRPALATLRVPTLVVHGRQDPIPLASSADVATALRGRLVVLEDCGHVPYIEQPDALFAAIRDFLRGEAA